MGHDILVCVWWGCQSLDRHSSRLYFGPTHSLNVGPYNQQWRHWPKEVVAHLHRKDVFADGGKIWCGSNETHKATRTSEKRFCKISETQTYCMSNGISEEEMWGCYQFSCRGIWQNLQNIFPPEFEISQFLGWIKSPRRSRGDFIQPKNCEISNSGGNI